MRSRRAIPLLALVWAASGCSGGDGAPPTSAPAAAAPDCRVTEGHEGEAWPARASADSRTRLGPGMKLKRTPKNLAAARRGEPLVVTGAVRTKDCRPLAGATVRAWQTNGDGDYGPGEGETMRCCYLQGAARTDARGRYALQTVVPGTYAGGRAHIHVIAGHDDATWLETEFLIDSNEPRARFDLVLPVSGAAG